MKYLDHGFVEVLEVMGSDTTIAMAARTSYNEDEYADETRNDSLVKYLVEHRHTSPVEMPSIIFRLKMPIFVMRQHVRHRTASLNEQSLRYVEHDGDYYLPSLDRIKAQSGDNKQGSGGHLSEGAKLGVQEMIYQNSEASLNTYITMVGAGTAKELARMVLGTNFYTTCVWKMDLHNLLHYLRLRTHSHAQWEIREMATLIEQFVEELFPVTHHAWNNYIRGSVTFSEVEMTHLREMVDLDSFSVDKIDGSKRRASSFLTKLRGSDV